MRRKILVAPSVLSADFSVLAKEIAAVERAGADLLHVDVMDGHFVPNITIGPCVVASLKKRTRLPLDVHLMISAPQDYVDAFIDAGSDIITFHREACRTPAKLLRKIRRRGVRAGLVIKPKTPVSTIERFLGEADLVLVMSVEPGFSGQTFMENALPKIRRLRRLKPGLAIEVDGGINDRTARLVVEAGATMLVAGNYVFKHRDYREAIASLRGMK